MAIGENIKQKRLKEGLTQEDLAELIFMDRTFISKVESNLSKLSIDQAALIAQAFECTIDELYYGGDHGARN